MKGIKFSLTALLCLALPALAENGPEQSTPYRTETEERQILTSANPELMLATALLRDGQLAAAREHFTPLADSDDQNVRFEARFQLGMIAQVERDFPAAIRHFLSILSENPTLARVRLELAQTYFRAGNFTEAAFHFQFIRADHNIPPEVHARVDQFLEASRRQRNWSVSFAAGILPDSNITGRGNRQQCVLTVFGQFCSEPEESSSGLGLRATSTVNHYLRLTKNWGLRTTLGFSATDFPGSNNDDFMLTIASGPRYIFGPGEISVQPTYSRRWLHGNSFNHQAGVRSDISWDIVGSQWTLMGNIAARRTFFDDNRHHTFEGNTYSISFTPRYMIDNRSFASFEIGYARDHLNAPEHSAHSFTLGAGYFIQSGLGVAFAANFSATRVLNDAPNRSMDYIDFDSPNLDDIAFCVQEGFMIFCYKNRRDTIWSANLGIHSWRWNWRGIFPSLRYSYVRRNSTMSMLQHERHRVELLANMRF